MTRPDFDHEAALIGERLAGIDESTARACSRKTPNVFHVLPHGSDSWDYGTTLFAGADMAERREILGSHQCSTG